MISRRKKTLSAAIVLMAGLALAWPFRRQAGSIEPVESNRTHRDRHEPAFVLDQSPTATTPIAMQRLPGPVDLSGNSAAPLQDTTTLAIQAGLTVNDPFQASNPFRSSSSGSPQTSPSPHVARPQPPADAPLLAEDYRPELQAVARSRPRPVYATAARADPPEAAAGPASRDAPRVYVVHNGDTLERLAKRYLGDERRALEIFDLNSETLTNPHLLPIGAEIFIPRDAKSVVEN